MTRMTRKSHPILVEESMYFYVDRKWSENAGDLFRARLRFERVSILLYFSRTQLATGSGRKDEPDRRSAT